MTRHHGSTRITPSGMLLCIDMENMSCASELDVPRVARLSARLRATVPVRAGDHTVIATSHHNALAAGLGWGGPALRRVRSGKDGADLELIEEMSDAAWIVSRYRRVVLAAGDRIYAESVARLKAAGGAVFVVPPDSGLSKTLALAAGPGVIRLASPIPNNVIPMVPTRKATA